MVLLKRKPVLITIMRASHVYFTSKITRPIVLTTKTIISKASMWIRWRAAENMDEIKSIEDQRLSNTDQIERPVLPSHDWNMMRQ